MTQSGRSRNLGEPEQQVQQMQRIEGFLILPVSGSDKYRGVDRGPFFSTIGPEGTWANHTVVKNRLSSKPISSFEWFRDASSIYDQNLVIDESTDLELLQTLEVATEIHSIICDELGPHEIVHCTASSTSINAIADHAYGYDFIGFDVAYPGGDFYSAIRNGLFVNPDGKLLAAFGKHLNEYGLFSGIKSAEEYVPHFRSATQSESRSEFWTFGLGLCQ